MSKEEYEAKRQEIVALMGKLNKQYIAENTTIEPGSVVMAAGQKCILKDYKVMSGHIYPILVKFTNKNSRVHVSVNAKIEKL